LIDVVQLLKPARKLPAFNDMNEMFLTLLMFCSTKLIEQKKQRQRQFFNFLFALNSYIKIDLFKLNVPFKITWNINKQTYFKSN